MLGTKPSFADSGQPIPYAELQNLNDERLVEEVRGGNADAFAVIFKRFHRLVHATAWKILRDASEAEDLTQTVFLEIYQRLAQFDPARGTLKLWLLQFTYSRAMHRRNYIAVRGLNYQIELGKTEEDSRSRSAHLQPQERVQLTNEVIAVLSPPQRETIEMYFYEGLTLREIAERRNEKFSNVRHHYYRGLERLRFYLEKGIPREVPLPVAVPSGEV